MTSPLLDRRTRDEVRRQALQLAGIDPPLGWPGYVPDWAAAVVDKEDDPGRRLIDVFSRLAELLIERVNRVPEKNFLAFLDLAGVERFPGAPAEVPVTFLVSKRAALGGVVPARTQVATVQTKTTNARVYETRRDFFATRARLERMIALNPGTDRFVALEVAPLPPTAASLAEVAPVQVLTDDVAGMTDVSHVLYLASEVLFSRKDVVDVSITIQFMGSAFPTDLAWRRYDKNAKAWVALPTPTVSFFLNQVTFTFPALTGVGKVSVNGVEDFWIAGSFAGSFPVAGLPIITAITGSVAAAAVPAAVLDAAFFNGVELDVSKPFLPFGGRPAYGDAFYIGSQTGFSPDNGTATVTLDIRPYTDADLQAQFAGITSAQTIQTIAKWQYLNAAGTWVDLATFAHVLTIAPVGGAITVTRTGGGVGEGTLIGSANNDASVQFAVPALPAIGVHEVHGVESRWLRVLLLSDKPYGNDGVITGSGATTKFIGPLLIPPRVEKITIGYTPAASAVTITKVRTFNDFAWRDLSPVSAGFVPFLSLSDYAPTGVAAFGASPALYLAFDQPFETAAFISLFVDLAGPVSTLTSPLESGAPNVAWEYWSGAGWRPLDVIDDTLDLTTSGVIGFPAPSDSAPVTLFEYADPDAKSDSAPRWWLRARLAGGAFDYPPRVRGVYVNSVMADNRSTFAELLVGSSNGEPNQEFVLVKAPVLGGELWVREPDRPTATELKALAAELEGDGVLTDGDGEEQVLDVRTFEGAEPEIWVRWRRVPNFELSGARSRHYLLDAVTAHLIFGGVEKGLIPPPLRDNLVMREFQTGGGARANRDTGALAVKELKTSLSYIDRVFNVQPAAGGASEWSVEQLMQFGPQALKTRGRSVTTEDYQWMILQRFSDVARVRCFAVREPGPGGTLVFKAGGVTALIVPWSTDARPQPTEGLIRKVREYLVGLVLANITNDVHVKGPDYVAVDIAAELVPTKPELASVVLRKAQAAIEAFLHPLTGGEHGEGYGFGRPVYLSEVHAVLGRIEDVDYVLSARFVDAPGADAFPIVGDRIASSGTHQLTIVPGEP